VKLVLATRGSPLALWQAEEARRLLSLADPQIQVELLAVHSSGDRDPTSDLTRFGRIGIFTVEVDRAVLDGRARAGVHSAKDMTTTLQEGMVLAGALARGPVEDVLVSRSGEMLAGLPAGARVATGSMRRSAMLRAVRPDLEVVSIRGNVETRVEKLDRGEADALLMARAGLVRLGLAKRITQVLPRESFLPAVGQGIVGLTARADDLEMQRRLLAISDREAWVEAQAERAFLRAIHGGCNAPIGAHARVRENSLVLEACVLSLDGRQCVRGEERGSVEHAEAIGEALAAKLLARGAGDLVAEARS
jgi:hydroxymethylbilane synthase